MSDSLFQCLSDLRKRNRACVQQKKDQRIVRFPAHNANYYVNRVGAKSGNPDSVECVVGASGKICRRKEKAGYFFLRSHSPYSAAVKREFTAGALIKRLYAEALRCA